jgi:hypothetical protein
MLGMRWALSASPRWRMALLRVDAPLDERRFKQKAPFETLQAGKDETPQTARPES